MQNFTQAEQFNSHSASAVALGFFDGLHKGHRRVIETAAKQKSAGLVPVCFTFSQSPKQVLKRGGGEHLMAAADKLKALESLGIVYTVTADFKAVMNMSAEEFAKKILFGRLNAKFVACGFNYRFGKGGAGDANLLESLCKSRGVRLCVLPPEKDGGRVVSSTLIRSLIKGGEIAEANRLLYSHFGFEGKIIHGKHLGHMMGTPTVNQELPDGLVVPLYGVYASRVTLESRQSFCGVTNIGVKPTVGGTALLCETWMPDYLGGDIYGQSADVRLLDFIRPEKKFANLDELKKAITDNAATAKKIYDSVFK